MSEKWIILHMHYSHELEESRSYLTLPNIVVTDERETMEVFGSEKQAKQYMETHAINGKAVMIPLFD